MGHGRKVKPGCDFRPCPMEVLDPDPIREHLELALIPL
jgi:hypothetical protein